MSKIARNSWRRSRLSHRLILLFILFLLYPYFSEISQAQTAPITPSGLNTHVNISAPPPPGGVEYDITGGTRPGGASGTNLFHSFGDFNVPANTIANFLNTGSIDLHGTLLPPNLPTDNIFGRVTEQQNPSMIFGMIQTNGPGGFGNANLFLMNPHGFLFGPNATVNVGGMVAFTSADYLKLADNVRFNAAPNGAADALLSASPVASFGFLGSNPGAITVQGSQFTVTEGTGISLVGGNIAIEAGTLADGTVQPAQLSAPGGQINLASVTSPGKVSAVDFMPTSGMTMGNISLSHGAILDVLADAAGTVRIRGGEFVMTDATLLADTGNVPGAPDAIDINLTGNLVISSAAVPALTARTTGAGDAGEIKISAKNIDITGTGFGDFTPFAVIDTHTSASGKAGNVTITATDNLTMTGDPADFVFAIDSGTIGTDGGQGGNVTLNAKNIDIQYASISTGDFVANGLGEEATGSGGSLTITADTVGLTSSSLVTDGFFAGKGGDLTISARDIQINQNSALSTGGVQQAGAIRITTDQLVVDESSFEVDNEAGPSGGVTIIGKKIEFTNGSTIGSQTFGDEAAGDIKITATEHLMFSDDPNTDGGSARPSGLFTNSLGNAGPLGNAGAIVVITPSLEITGGARIDSTTRTSGQGGPITITTDTISISGGRPDPIFETQFNQGGLASGIYSRTVGSKFCAGPCGSAGSISITNDVFDLTQGAQINSVTTSTGRGGDITISAAQSVALSDRASLTVSSTGPGNAGNIEINAGNLFAMTNSSLTAEASQAGGGAIKITTNPGGTVQLFNSLISASVLDGMGGGGSVNIDPQYVILQNSQILAQAVQGPGGKIKINITNGGLFLPDANSLLSASSQFGVSGTVTIQSPNAPISGHIQPLGATPLIATSLLNQHCAALAGGQFSSFTVAGRDSLPTEPGSWLASPLYAGGVEPRLKAEGVQAEGMSASAGQVVSSEWMGDGLSGVSGVVRAGLVTHQTDQIDKLDQTDQFLFSLRQIAPAGFLTQAFAGDRSAGCRS